MEHTKSYRHAISLLTSMGLVQSEAKERIRYEVLKFSERDLKRLADESSRFGRQEANSMINTIKKEKLKGYLLDLKKSEL